MAATLAGASPYQNISLGTLFNSMASGSTVITGVLTIPVLTGSSSYAIYSELVLEGTGLVTTGAGSPYFQATPLPETPGGTYQETGVSNSQLFPIGGLSQFSALPSTALTVILVPFIWSPPIGSIKLSTYNNLGAALASGVTANLRIYGASIG